jgi:hypothetical protein
VGNKNDTFFKIHHKFYGFFCGKRGFSIVLGGPASVAVAKQR